MSPPYFGSRERSIDWRGISVFLAIAFGLAWAAELIAIASGMRFATMSGVRRRFVYERTA